MFKLRRLKQGKQKTQKRNCAGFSLIELMVAVSIFAIVVTVATGACFIIFDSLKRTQNSAAVLNSVDFAFDFIVKRSINNSLRCDHNVIKDNNKDWFYNTGGADSKVVYCSEGDSLCASPIILFPSEVNATITCYNKANELFQLDLEVGSNQNIKTRISTEFGVKLTTFIYNRKK